jgi:hypothetical protein
VLDGETARAMADTGEKIHTLSATLQGTGVKGFMVFKGDMPKGWVAARMGPARISGHRAIEQLPTAQ